MRMTNVQTIKDYNLTPNIGVQSNKLVDQSSALTIKAIDLQKITDKMKKYMEGSNEKSIIGILGLIKNLLPEGIQLDRINQLINEETSFQSRLQNNCLNKSNSDINHYMNIQLKILKEVTSIYCDSLPKKSSLMPKYKMYNNLAVRCLRSFEKNNAATIQKVMRKKDYFLGDGSETKLESIQLIFDILVELGEIFKHEEPIGQDYFQKYKNQGTDQLISQLDNINNAGKKDKVSDGHNTSTRIPTFAFEGLINANDQKFETPEIKEQLFKEALNFSKQDPQNNNELISKLEKKNMVILSEKVKRSILEGKQLNISAEDLNKEYWITEQTNSGHTIGSYILFKKGENSFRKLLSQLNITDVQKKIEETKKRCELVVGLSSYVSGNQWKSKEFHHLGSESIYKARIMNNLTQYNSKNQNLGNVIQMFNQKRVGIKSTNQQFFEKSTGAPKLFEIVTKNHYFMAISYQHNGEDFVTFVDRAQAKPHITLSLADANYWLEKNRNSLSKLPFNKQVSNEKDAFNLIKNPKKMKVGKCTFANQKAMIKYLLWLDKLSKKAKLDSDDMDNIEKTYKDFTKEMRLSQANIIDKDNIDGLFHKWVDELHQKANKKNKSYTCF